MKQFLGEKITLFGGDSRDVLKQCPDNSIDSILTDPPYALVSIVKRFGKPGAAPAKGNEAYMRASAGFMGQTWDTGEVAFDPDFWAECLRVLKPGGHMLAFGGTRTYHRMTCAIEDAGFEIRDMMQWLYGSGFPKSHDVSKGIDKAGGQNLTWFGPWLRVERERIGMSQKELSERGGFFKNVNHGGLVANWEVGYGVPSAKQFNKVCELLDLRFTKIEELEREIIGTCKVNAGVAFSSDGPTQLDITAPATLAAQQWEGWGSSLKPANEPICLARKPLSEKTIAANVLKWGTGAINIDGCRVEHTSEADRVAATPGGKVTAKSGALAGKAQIDFEKIARKAGWIAEEEYNGEHDGVRSATRENWAEDWEGACKQDNLVDTRAEFNRPDTSKGRWPANIITDGSDEVVAAFPESNGRPAKVLNRRVSIGYGGSNTPQEGLPASIKDSGSAARFFYAAKANKKDRAGSKHPTVKPINLLRYLARLITPPGGMILDPFAGSGTTGEAAYMEGFSALLIEREEQFQKDIEQRFLKLDNIFDRTTSDGIDKADQET